MDKTAAQYFAFLNTRYFRSLDGLRCISIVAVIWSHSGMHQGGGLLARGHLGVDLFFVISGFLITTLLLREKEQNSRISLRNFYARRTLRIFPLYYLVLLVYILVVLRVERWSPPGVQFFHNLPFFVTYTSNWFVDLKSGNRVIFYFAWSLATEEQFYAIWPWVIRFTRGWLGPIIFVVGLLLVDQLAEGGVSAGYLDGSVLGVRILTNIATPICLGCIAGYVLQQFESFRSMYAVAGQGWSAPLAAIALVLALALDRTPHLLIHLAMAYLLITCCIRSDHPLRAVFGNPVVRYVGMISYGMYLLHMLAINAARRILPESGSTGLFILGLSITVALASISYWVFERPILQVKERFGNRLQRTPAGLSPAHGPAAAG